MIKQSHGVLSPIKSPDSNASDSPDDDQEDSYSGRREDMSDAKSGSKLVRILTVMAYVLCVSMAAILLSLYYVLIWDPPKQLDIPDEPENPSALRADDSMFEQMKKLLSPTPIPLTQDTSLTTQNSSLDYSEGERELDTPEFEDLLNSINDTYVEKRQVVLNNLTDNFIMNRLKSILLNSSDSNNMT